MTDTDNAKKLGISRAQVEVRRKRMGIPRHFPKKPERVWLPEHDAILGVKTDSEVAAMLGITRWIYMSRRNRVNKDRRRNLPSPTQGHAE